MTPKTVKIPGSHLSIEIPGWPVGVNQRYRIVDNPRTGRAHLKVTEDAHSWEFMAANKIKEAAAKQGFYIAKRTPFHIAICLTMPRNEINIRDVDGVVKPILDTAAKALELNDAWCREVYVRKDVGPELKVAIYVEEGQMGMRFLGSLKAWLDKVLRRSPEREATYLCSVCGTTMERVSGKLSCPLCFSRLENRT